MRTITVKLPKGWPSGSTPPCAGEERRPRPWSARRSRTGCGPPTRTAPRTCRELCADLEGSLSGPADLSSNANRLKGYGR